VLAALPAHLQVRLSGKPAIELDRDTLAPDLQMMLALNERRGRPPMHTLPPAEARLMRRRQAAVYAGKALPVGSVADLELDTPVALRARHYAPPEQPGPHPLLVFYHGGGFVFGDLDTHDGVCRALCSHTGAHVLAIDYRLAPEHRFPAAVEDAHAAFAWAREHAPELGADPRLIGVGGDSAGGNLAAVVSQLTTRGVGPAPALQLLIYPATELAARSRSRDLFGEGFLLTNDEMDWFETCYLGPEHAHQDDPRVSPLRGEDLSGLPPALIVTAAFDPLRDEGEEYGRALRAAGTPATVRRFPGTIHGFVNMAGVSRGCRDALMEIAGAVRAMFAEAEARSGAAVHEGSPALARDTVGAGRSAAG
jgi:acetyl esterase